MPNYQVHMWLDYTPANPVALSEFQKRFPGTLASAWWSFTKTAADSAALATLLNAEILSKCKVWLDEDSSMNVTEVKAFTVDIWEINGGGLHEAASISVEIIKPSQAYWSFDYNNTTYYMLAGCHWMVVI